MSKKRRKLPGTVKRVIKSANPSQAEKAEIDIHEADELYKEIRIENVVQDDSGGQSKLKEGEPVDVIIEADFDATAKKSEHS